VTDRSRFCVPAQQQKKQQEEGMAVTKADCCSREDIAVGRRFCALYENRFIKEHCEKTSLYRRCEFVTAVTMNIPVFCDLMLYHMIAHYQLATSIFRIEE
jgi:hypothetical protein